ncbi:MAG: hypothetical protein AAFY45_07400 [Bacteroidota bacterium]
MLWLPGPVHAQRPSADAPIADISPLFQFDKLSKKWKEPNGAEWEVPFQFEETDPRSLRYDFRICTGPQDSVYLYFEGLAWDAELEIDNIYLGTHHDPFKPWIVALASSWVDNKKVQLQLSLSTGSTHPNYPKSFMGIYRSVYLLGQEEKEKLTRDILPASRQADTLAVVAPYYQEGSYIFDPAKAAEALLPAYERGIRDIYFPFSAGRELQAFAKELGFKETKEYDPALNYALINKYPFDRSSFTFANRFWLDESGRRQSDYMVFVAGERSFFEKWSPILDRSTFLILLILFPIISLFLIKLANPGFFYGLLGLLINPKLYISSSTEVAAFSNQGLLYILHLLSLCNVAVWLSLGIYYMQSINYWEFLHIFREESLLGLLFNEEDSLFVIFSKSFSLMLSWFVLKQILLGFLGGIFRIKGMRLEILGLEIVADYPLILLLSTPFALFLFMDSFWGRALFFLAIFIALIYYVRTLYVLYVGLDRLFSFSYTVKFLYICSLNVIPYFILL